MFKSSAKSGTFLLLISIVTAPDVAAPDVAAKELDEWRGQAADSLGSPCPQRNEQIYQAPPAFLSMRQDGRGSPREALGTQGSVRLAWGEPLAVQDSPRKKKKGVGEDKGTKELEGARFPGGPTGSLLISKRRANQSVATGKVKGQRGNRGCQRAKGRFRERTVGGLLCLWVSLISEPLWPRTEPWVPTGSCLFKQN